MVLIDQDKSTKKAFKNALKVFRNGRDTMFLVHVYSNWDYLNDEHNSGKLILEEYNSYCEAVKVRLRILF